MIEIKSRWDGRVLYTAEHAQDVRAALREAVKVGADLSGADLSGADLRSADLRSADLRSADLSCADLSNAYLSGADLSGAVGIAPELSTDLLMLLDQVGKIRAYKLVNQHGQGPVQGGITYEVGQTVSVPDADTDPTKHCAAGINVATLPWCLKEWRPGYRILILEFIRKDIAAIPHATDGKFRVHRARVVGEKQFDPVALGLVKAEVAR